MSATIIIVTLLIILGTALGSLLSVIIHRIEHQEKGIIIGRSRCPHCRKTLASADLVPIFSYIYLRGKCRYCNKKISPMYFFLEITSALVLILIYLKFPFAGTPGAASYFFDTAMALKFSLYAINSILLIGIFFHDLQYSKIPDIFIWPFVIVSLANNIANKSSSFPDLLIACAIALVFFGGQRLLSKGNWLGEGDVYVSIGMALLFGWKLFIVAIVLTYLAGGIIGFALLAMRKVEQKSKIPFAPFMVFGTFATILYGQEILNWYANIL